MVQLFDIFLFYYCTVSTKPDNLDTSCLLILLGLGERHHGGLDKVPPLQKLESFIDETSQVSKDVDVLGR